MRDINKLKEKAIEIIQKSGVEIPESLWDVKVEYRYTPRAYGIFYRFRRWGVEWEQIYLDPVFQYEHLPEEPALATMIHELVHAMPGGEGHDGVWVDIMKTISRYDDRYGITARYPSTYFTTGGLRMAGYKYADVCPSCGAIYFRRTSPAKGARPSFCTSCNVESKVILDTRKHK